MNITLFWIDEAGCDVEADVDLPSIFQLCPRCKGEGSHVNPAIDGNGITTDEMDDLGVDFQDDYMAGVYDVACHRCNGKRVIEVIDRDRCDPDDLRRYDENQQELNDMRAMERMEKLLGA